MSAATAVVGLGSDLLNVDRIARMGARNGRLLLDRVLSPAERIAFAGRGESPADWPGCARDVAAVMACKEAFFKALGSGLVRPLRWSDVTVSDGRPFGRTARGLSLTGASAEAFARRGGRALQLTLDGAGAFLLATVLLLGRPAAMTQWDQGTMDDE